jgi:fatty acid-binding protein DegV
LQDLISLKKNSKLNDNSINNLINHYRDHCGAALIVPDLTHLVNGGRINKTKGLIAKLLHIIPFNSFDREGVTNRANTKKISEFPKLCDEYFRKIITNFDYKNIERSGILMSKNYSDKFKINDIDKVILDNVASKIPKGIKIQRSILSSVIVAHTGPNYYAFILLTKK